jgi:plastocyanin
MRRLITTASLAIVAIVIAACGSGSASPAASVAPPSNDPNAPAITAKDLAFTTPSVAIAAGKPVNLTFDNEDGAPHNVTIAVDEGYSNVVFKGDIFSGPSTKTYQVPALTAGTYHFRCDVHPNMIGTITAR